MHGLVYHPCYLPQLASPSFSGTDVTLVGYGAQIQHLRYACQSAREELDVSCELIDLRTIVPWDLETVANVRELVVAKAELTTLNSSAFWFMQKFRPQRI